jgi:hypothetical protein
MTSRALVLLIKRRVPCVLFLLLSGPDRDPCTAVLPLGLHRFVLPPFRNIRCFSSVK